MSDPVYERSVIEAFRKEVETAISNQTQILIDRTSDRQAGFVQGLQAALGTMNEIIQSKNSDQSRKQKPQHQEF